MQIVTLNVVHPCPLSGPIARASGARATHLFHRGRGVTVEVHAEEPSSLGGILGGYERVGATVVHQDGRSSLVRFPACPCCLRGEVISTIEAAGHQYLPPVRYSSSGEAYEFLVLNGPPPRSVLRRLREEVRVTRVRAREWDASGFEDQFLIPWSDLIEGITGKQRAALLAGISGGYFRTPRQIGSDRLAKRFEISRPAFGKLLRRAEERLLDSLAPYLTAGTIAAGSSPPSVPPPSPSRAQRSRGRVHPRRVGGRHRSPPS
jgi:predicted DNA binding protein